MLSACRDDLEYLSAIASLPDDQSTFDYLVGCWKRGNKIRSELLEKVSGDPMDLVWELNSAQRLPPAETQQAVNLLDKLRDIVISYTGLALQQPKKFPQPPKWVVPSCTFSPPDRPP